ncbi:tetratricopeptide repeat protein [Streptomyces sp. NPDC091278]|uniref:tetratricopeptide repeat protein n=1 Tax=Streptomyces sp. NPDC091278 TaxID=3155301 RepID=UPI00344D0E74
MRHAGRTRRGETAGTALLWGEQVTTGQLAAAEEGYARCGPAERLLWERLSVFEGAFGREAVRAVCGFGELPPARVLVVLDRLAPLALLPVDDLFDGEPAEPRYWMPHPVRAVGARRLSARGDRPSVVPRHRRWSLELARRAADRWRDGRQLDARDLALRELPDLAAAMDPTTASGAPGEEAATAVETAVTLWFLWVACGRVAEGRTRLRHALSLYPGPPPARALWLAGFLELESGRPEEATRLLGRAVEAAERDGDDGALGVLAHLRGSAALHQGRTRASAAAFRESLELVSEPTDFGPSRHGCWVGLALSLCRTDPGGAREALGGAEREHRAGDARPADVYADAWAEHVRAELAAWDGDPERAAGHARRALRAHLDLGSSVGAAVAAELLAQMRSLGGRKDTAARLLGAVDLLRTSAFEPSYRPARFVEAVRAHRDRDRDLRSLRDDPALRDAFEEGARLGLFTLADCP